MNNGRSHPPAAAVWFLRHLCPKRNKEAITGDLLERFCEGHSNGWFWRQVLVAIVMGASSELRLRWMEICLAAAGTALIGCIPWGLIFPVSAMTTSMNWPARLQWLIVIEIATALTVLPLFAVLFRLWMTLRGAILLRVFFICAMLLTVGDLPIIWWSVSHHVISESERTWVVALQLVWIFAILLISARAIRHLHLPSKTIPR